MAYQRLTNRADPNLYEARAIVLSKMGQNRQALDIYVFKLNDPEKAEEWENLTLVHIPSALILSKFLQSDTPYRGIFNLVAYAISKTVDDGP